MVEMNTDGPAWIDVEFDEPAPIDDNPDEPWVMSGMLTMDHERPFCGSKVAFKGRWPSRGMSSTGRAGLRLLLANPDGQSQRARCRLLGASPMTGQLGALR